MRGSNESRCRKQCSRQQEKKTDAAPAGASMHGIHGVALLPDRSDPTRETGGRNDRDLQVSSQLENCR
jgi:hypothetical protein